MFTYSFPHKKSQDVLLRLFYLGIPVDLVIASDPVPLNIPPPSVRTKIRHVGLLDMRILSERIGARYVVAHHNSEFAIELLQEYKPDIGVIGGARILKSPVLAQFRIGVLNLHPGLIPEARGLDAIMWSIYNDIPIGVTAHLIDGHIDAGRILIKEEVPIYSDDTILDVSERVHEWQVMLIDNALSKALKGEWTLLDSKVLGRPNRKMTPSQEAETLAKFEAYKIKHAKGKKDRE